MQFKFLTTILPLLSLISRINAETGDEQTCSPFNGHVSEVTMHDVEMIKTKVKTSIGNYDAKVATLPEWSQWKDWCTMMISSVNSNSLGNSPYSLIQYDSIGKYNSESKDEVIFSVKWTANDGKNEIRYFNTPKNGKCRVLLQDKDFISLALFNTVTVTFGLDY